MTMNYDFPEAEGLVVCGDIDGIRYTMLKEFEMKELR